MAKFFHNNVKNASTNYTPFELNCDYYPKISFKKDVDPYLKSCSVNKLAEKLRELMKVCYQNLLHIQELQKRDYDIRVKSSNYVLSEKVWLQRKYIKTKRNKKFKSKFFKLF